MRVGSRTGGAAPALCMSSVVGEPAPVAGEYKAQERAAPRARVSRAERFLAAQDRTGPHREYARGAALERRTHDAALRNARGAECKRNDRGRKDRKRTKILAKNRNEPMRRAWARSGRKRR